MRPASTSCTHLGGGGRQSASSTRSRKAACRKTPLFSIRPLFSSLDGEWAGDASLLQTLMVRFERDLERSSLLLGSILASIGVGEDPLVNMTDAPREWMV